METRSPCKLYMIKLTDLLTRFKGITNIEKAKKELVAEICSVAVGSPITHNQISFSKNTIFIKTEPIIKTEVALKKGDILTRITALPGMRSVTDIR